MTDQIIRIVTHDSGQVGGFAFDGGDYSCWDDMTPVGDGVYRVAHCCSGQGAFSYCENCGMFTRHEEGYACPPDYVRITLTKVEAPQ